DRRDLGVGDEALPPRRIPVEENPDPVVLVRVAEHGRALRAVLLALLGALGREDLHEPVEVLDLCCCQDHPSPPSSLDRMSMRPAIPGRIGRTPYPVWTRSCSKAQTVAAARLRTPAFW